MVKTPVSHNFFTKSEKNLLEQLSTYISFQKACRYSSIMKTYQKSWKMVN